MTTINKKNSKRTLGRLRRKARIRKTLFGTKERPRMSVFKSAKHLYVQLVDDLAKVTLASSSTLEKALDGKVKGTVEGAKEIGKQIAKKALAKGIEAVVFDRGGFRYHGQLKALAEAAREGGLKF